MEAILIGIGLFILISGGLIWGGLSVAKQSKKDWETLAKLQKRCNEVSTKEEIETFYQEFVIEAKKIHNQYIYPELKIIEGYLKGLYKQVKND